MPQLYLKNLQMQQQTVNPLFNFLGVAIEIISREKVILHLPFQHNFLQGAGVIAGGMIAALADEAMAHVVLANLNAGESTATIEMNIRYLKATARGEIIAEAVLIKKGGRVITVQADIVDDKRQLVAQAGASFIVITKKM